MKRFRKSLAICFLVLLISTLFISCSQSRITKIKKGKENIKIGTKNTTEQKLFSEALKILIEENSDYTAEVISFGGTGPIFTALINKDIDVYCEYTATMYSSLLLGQIPKGSEGDLKDLYQKSKDGMDNNFNITVLDPIGFESNYAICVKPETKKKYSLETITNLVPYSKNMILAGSFEWAQQADGFDSLNNTYGLEFLDNLTMEQGLVYDALLNENADLVAVNATDGTIKKYNLHLLKDDKHAFIPNYLCPLIDKEFGTAFPEVKEAANMLSGKVTIEKIQNYNLMMEGGEYSYNDIARLILKEFGLIS